MAKSSFYGVKVGKNPGIYTSWADCEAQIKGFPNAQYKKFNTQAEAEAFVAGTEVSKPTNVDLPDGPYAFVDGSFNPETKVFGFGGFVVVDNKRYDVMGCGTNEDMASMRNVAGEICGSIAAVQKAEELGLKELTILYDYKGIEQWATGGWKTNNQWTKAYSSFMNSGDRKANVVFQKVEAHTGIEGNEIADVMAKTAVGIELTPAQQKLFDSYKNNKAPIPEPVKEDSEVDITDQFELI